MPIACVYCGAAHDRADQVRACWQRQGSPDEPAASAPPPERAAVVRAPAAPAAPEPVPVVATGPPARWAGPPELARHLVAPPGLAVPAPWDGVEEIALHESDLTAPHAVLDALTSARAAGRRFLVRTRLAERDVPSDVDVRPLHLVGAHARLVLDELRHAVWRGAVVVATDGSARFPPVDIAVAGGARPVTDGTADVELPGVGPCWIDAGDLRHRDPVGGVPVIPLVSLEHGGRRPLGPNTPSAELAPDQLAAVAAVSARARIIAPAGSGKTRVLTERARHLVRGWRLPPAAITLVAYNKRAQLEVQERLADVPGVHARTLNALALAIVTGAPPFAPTERTWRTIDERDVRRVLERFVQSPRRRNVDPLAPWLDALSAARLGLRHPDEVEAAYGGDVDGFAQVLPRYEEALDTAGQLDFDGQIVTAIRLLLADPATRAAAQRACRILLVDEFQDLTPAHILLVRLLAGPGTEIFGVGDDDQTIYGYNGADPSWLVDFERLVPGAADHPLEVNYRCPADVVAAADRLLRRNRRRVPKTIRAAKADRSGMEAVAVADPLAATIAAVRAALDAGAPAADVAVLGRVNAVLVPVQVALRAAGIPTTHVAGPEFLARTSVRAAVAWVRLASAPGAFAAQDLAEALRRPSRSLHPRVAEWVAEQSSLDALERLAARLDSERDAERVRAFATDLARVRRTAARGTTAQVLRLLTDDLGLAGTVASLDANRRGMNQTSQSDDLLALSHLATLHADPASFPSWLASELDRRADPSGVTVATVHRVKGQEWPHVVVHLADADQFPHRLADDVEEERRVFHVAITRTSDRVTVVSTDERASPFVRESATEPSEDPVRREPAVREPAPVRRVAERPAGALAADGVVAGTGIGLVDQGRTWVIDVVDDEGARAVCGGATRRFAWGTKVVTTGRQRGALVRPADGTPPAAPAVFDELRTLRDRLRGTKPAYTVFDDATLERIALALPGDLAALARVKGVGPMKLDQYGDQVLGVVAEHG